MPKPIFPGLQGGMMTIHHRRLYSGRSHSWNCLYGSEKNQVTQWRRYDMMNTGSQKESGICNFCTMFLEQIIMPVDAHDTPCGTPNLPKALSCPIFPAEPRWRAYSNVSPVIPVSIRPGQIVLTRISVFWSWYAEFFAIEFTLEKRIIVRI